MSLRPAPAMAALLVLSVAACTTPGVPRQTAPVPVEPSTPVPPLAMVSGVGLHAPMPGVYTSAQPGAGDWMRLPALCIGTVINLPAGKRTTTTSSSTQFLAGAPLDSVVTGESLALHKGRTTMVWQTSIRSDTGRLCAVVTQTQLVLEAGR